MKKLLFIVNGEDVRVPSFDYDTLGDAKHDALAISRNTGRPAEDWELRDERGVRLEPETNASLFFGKPVFLTLAIGAGG